MKWLFSLTTAFISIGAPSAHSDGTEGGILTQQEQFVLAAKVGCAEERRTSVALGGVVISTTILRLQPQPVPVPRIEATVIANDPRQRPKIRIGPANEKVVQLDSLNADHISTITEQVESEWVSSNAYAVYPQRAVDCFISALARLHGEQDVMSNQIISRQNRAEATVKKLNTELSVELLARVTELEQKLDELRRRVDSLAAFP